MGLFTLTQNFVERNLYLYPNGDLSTCTEFAAVGNSPNFACVDEDRLLPNEDTDYVWWNNVALGLDLYELPNCTTETGIINYVQVYARAKSHDIPQKVDGIYKIICSPDSVCSNVYESADINLVTNYTTYSKVWKKNPDDSNDWEWADINALSIGAKCNSPIITGATHTITLRPNGAGDKTEAFKVGAATNWECVDEIAPDYLTTYTWTDNASGDKIDLYHMENSGIGAGVIKKVTFFAVFRSSTFGSGITLRAKTHGVEYAMGSGQMSADWNTESWVSTTNPFTGVAWTVAEVDAVQSGYDLWTTTAGKSTFCTQSYMVVEYDDTIAPQIRTTQCYAKINYTTDELTCKLNKPDTISTNHARNIKMLNFWDGSREVYDLNRSGKSMVLAGEITDRNIDEPAWCDTSYAFRKKITIDHDQVDGDLTNFPVYLDVNLNRRCLNANGYDVMFCDSSCSEYSFEIENYSSDGKLKAWVKIPAVSSTANTVFWIYYRKKDATVDPSTTAVWDDAGYSTVFHMTDEDLTRDTIKDSTDAAIVGAKGGANEPTEINARLHKGQRGDGINDVIEIPDHADLNMQQSNFTFSLWIKSPANQGAVRDIICKNKDAGTAWFLLRQGQTADSDRIWFYNYQDALNHHRLLTSSTCDDTWHLYHFVVDYSQAGNDRLKAYIDGVFDRNADVFVGNPNITSVDNVRMFRGTLSGTSGYWKGTIDELRWAKGIILSVNWMKAEAANQKENSTFVSYGYQQENYADIINACSQIICVRDMARNGSVVAISKLVPLHFSGDYRINSFGWDKVSSRPENYRWILELEDAD